MLSVEVPIVLYQAITGQSADEFRRQPALSNNTGHIHYIYFWIHIIQLSL